MELLHRGKVRDVYSDRPGEVILVATDRVSVYDVVLPKVNVCSVVVPVELVAMPWATNGRNGVTYKAKTLNAASGAGK